MAHQHIILLIVLVLIIGIIFSVAGSIGEPESQNPEPPAGLTFAFIAVIILICCL